MSHHVKTSAFGTGSQSHRKTRKPAKARKARWQRRLQMEQLEGRWLLDGSLDWQSSDDPLISIQLTALASPSEVDTATAVPTSLTHVDPNSEFHLEIWVQDVNSEAGTGIVGGYVTLSDTTQATEALSFDHGGIFNLGDPAEPENSLTSGTINNEQFRVEDFGGGTMGVEQDDGTYLGVGIAPNWARLGYVTYLVTGTDQITIASQPGELPFALWALPDGTGGNVDNEDVDYGALSLSINPSTTLPTINVGDHVLLAGAPDQSFGIFVTGGGQVQGLNLFVQVEDGGPEVDPVNGVAGPAIAHVDILGATGYAPTIFTGNNTGDGGAGAILPQFWQSGTTTQSGTVLADPDNHDGRVASVVIDASGFQTTDPNNPFSLKLKDTLMGDSDFGVLPIHITNGRLILKDRPTAVIAGATEVDEGQAVTLNCSDSFAWDPNDTIVACEWYLESDGEWSLEGIGETFGFDALDGPSTVRVGLQVKDSNYAQNPLFTSEWSIVEITIKDVPPTIELSGAAEVDEGSTYTLTLGPITDPGQDTVTQWIVHWGDGTSDTYTSGGDVTYVYVDDDPSGTAFDPYTIRVDLVDENGTHQNAGILEIIVKNVPPELIDPLPDKQASRGQTVTLSGVTFTDPGGIYETYTATINWGDGTGDKTGSVIKPDGGQPGVINGSHVYQADGDYLVTVTIADDDLGQDSGTFTVTIASPTVVVGEHVLLAGAVNPAFAIFVDGGQAVEGADVFVQVADGGPDGIPPGTIAGPAIAHVDILGADGYPPTVFTGNHTGQGGGGSIVRQFWHSGTTTSSGTVAAQGRLATVVIDATGIQATDSNNPFDLKLSGTLMGDTSFGPILPNVTNGRLILKDKPTAVIAGATEVDEGSTVQLNCLDSFAWDPNDTIVACEWDLNNDGIFETTGNTVTVPALDGPDVLTVRLRVRDNNHAQNPLFEDILVLNITVHNVAPTIALSGASSVNEGSTYTLTLGEITDPGQDTVTQWIVHWGDGTSDTYTSGGDVTHVYVDDDPSGTAFDPYTILVDLMDEDGTHENAGVWHITVHNVPPEFEVRDWPDQTARREQLVSLPELTFTDPGLDFEDYTATVNWGDGTGDQPATVTPPTAGVPGTVSATYSYSDDGTYQVTVTIRDDDLGEDSLSFTMLVKSGEVVERWVFYNNSYYDGNNPGANANDFNAIHPHTSITGGHGPHPTGLDEPLKELGKDPLLPGQTATFANYTGYSKGLNGIMVDMAGLGGVLTTADFQFQIGNSNDPSGWAVAPSPTSITVFPGAGALDGQGVASDRVTIIWADNAIQNTWLQITVLATANTALDSPDVFYFGNAIGESGSGNTSTFAFVTITDELAARNHPHNFMNRATVYDPCDYNKDSFVTITDELIARNHGTNFTNALRLITVPAQPEGGAAGGLSLLGSSGESASGPFSAPSSEHGDFVNQSPAPARPELRGSGHADIVRGDWLTGLLLAGPGDRLVSPSPTAVSDRVADVGASQTAERDGVFALWVEDAARDVSQGAERLAASDDLMRSASRGHENGRDELLDLLDDVFATLV